MATLDIFVLVVAILVAGTPTIQPYSIVKSANQEQIATKFLQEYFKPIQWVIIKGVSGRKILRGQVLIDFER